MDQNSIWGIDLSKMNLSEIMDCDQFSTRLNLNLDNTLDTMQGQEEGMMSSLGGEDFGSSLWSTLSVSPPSPKRGTTWSGTGIHPGLQSPVRNRRNSNNTSSCTYSPAGRMTLCTPSHKRYEYECVFCKGNNQPDYVYKNHPIRINETVVCPALRNHICGICGATGDSAHTIKYCPFNKQGFYAGNRQGTKSSFSGGASYCMMNASVSTEENNGMQLGNWKCAAVPTSPTISPKKSAVRKLVFDDETVVTKSTPGFFKNLKQLQTTKTAEEAGNNDQWY